MPVEARFLKQSRLFWLVPVSGIFISGVAGCHRTPGSDVVATVNSKDIPRAELDRQYQILKISQGETPQDPSPEQTQIAQLTLLRQIIDEEILQQRAVKLNVAASDEDVNAALTEKKAPYTEEEFARLLKQHNETLDDYKRDLRRALTQNKLLNKEIDSKINITDGEISNYYTAHKADFNLIEPRYNIARIVVTTGLTPQPGAPQPKPVSEADAKAKITSIHQRLESGEDFGTLAMNFSEDKDSAANGGDVGFVFESQLRNSLPPDVYSVLSNLRPGQFTGVIPGVDPTTHKVAGFAIYKLLSREAAGQRALNDPRVQQGIRQGLREGHAQLLKTAYLEMLRDDAKVHNYLADQIIREGAK